MAFSTQPGPSSQPQPQPFQFSGFETNTRFRNHNGSSNPGSPYGYSQPPPNPDFNIIEWYPIFQSCHRYFLSHAQHHAPVQALSAFLNIQLPYQKDPYPVISSAVPSGREARESQPYIQHPSQAPPAHITTGHPEAISLIPYIRRLVATGHDTPDILHGFFGDDWVKGIGRLHEVERRNFLFACKSQDWVQVKQSYDMPGNESCPFISQLRNVTEKELQYADAEWSKWLCSQDWMLGPRTPATLASSGHSPQVKREPRE